ncbi:AlbA family DNA-binding domain-containing protein [Micromonospora sp. I033]
MPLSQIRYLPNWQPYREALVTSDGFTVQQNRAADFVAQRDAVANVSLASLRRALIAAAENHGMFPERLPGRDLPVLSLYLTEVEPELIHEDFIPYSAYTINLMESRSLVLELSEYLEADLEPYEIATSVTHLLQRYSASLRDVEPEGVDKYCHWHIRVDIDRRGRTVGQALSLADELSDLMRALEGRDSPQFQALWDLLRSGKFNVLVGQPESATLEVKSQGYTLDDEAGKIELAQDVARFANAEKGGVLVIGMRTKRIRGEEVISRITPVRNAPKNAPSRYRSTIDRRVYPPIDGLEVGAVEVESNGSIILVKVPPQPEELKPFIVHGAMVGGRSEGAFISIVRRRDEGSIPISGPAIHAWLSAGRALMRGGHLPATASGLNPSRVPLTRSRQAALDTGTDTGGTG